MEFKVKWKKTDWSNDTISDSDTQSYNENHVAQCDRVQLWSGKQEPYQKKKKKTQISCALLK
jgi:hypothetical protein